MKKFSLFIIVFFSFFIQRVEAQDSSHLRVSLLTCAQGDELYSVFGHTALRIIDSVQHTDIVYNYGTFDFNDPDFYMKFTRGTLDYMLSAYYFQDFMAEYYAEKRSVTEQELILTGDAKNNLNKALQENLAGAARYYKYVFNYNNCTSRIRDLLFQHAGLQPDRQLVPAGTTCRNMLHEALDNGDQPWSKLGIDILLGSRIDKPVSISESMFLPDYLMKGVDSSVHSHNILLDKKIIYNAGVPQKPHHNWPLYIFSAIALPIILVSSGKKKTAQRITRFFDITLFLLTGLIGCLLLFMWFGTDHKACGANYNLLWALPTNLIVVFALWKKPLWLQKYFSVCMVIHLLTLLLWFWLPQQLNIGLIPVVVLLLQRCWKLLKSYKLSKSS
ncbi:MAG: hypothetical protein JWQ30_1572 [Sediminibacterium sp.]|nr:hypothetical protein [Sediminibacterium sp.]